VTRVGLVAKPDAAQAQSVILRLVEWFGRRGMTVVLGRAERVRSGNDRAQ